MITILLGIISSTVAEIVTALNKKLSGTVLQGDAAFLIAFCIAIIGALVKEVTAPGFTIPQLTDWTTLSSDFAQIFAISQVYFVFVTKKLGLDVPTPDTSATAAKPTDVSAGV